MKKNLTPTSGHKKWLKEVAKYYEVTESEIINGSRKPDAVVARQTFYWLCWRDGIDSSKLSVHLGKDRSTVTSIMNQGWKHRERNIENQIYEKVTSKKNLSKEKREVKASEGGLCSNVEVSGRLVFVSTNKK